jgi:hypothetical protein
MVTLQSSFFQYLIRLQPEPSTCRRDENDIFAVRPDSAAMMTSSQYNTRLMKRRLAFISAAQIINDAKTPGYPNFNALPFIFFICLYVSTAITTEGYWPVYRPIWKAPLMARHL